MRSLRTELRLTSLVTAVLLVLVGLTGTTAVVLSDNGFSEAAEGVVPALAANNDVLRAANSVDSALRGYVISADDTFLEPYEQGLRDLPDRLAALESSIADDPRAQELIAQQERALDAWLGDYATIRVDDPVGPRNVDPARLRAGADLYEQVRLANEELRIHLRDRLQDLREDTSRIKTVTILVLVVITALGVAIGMVASRAASRRVRRPLDQLRRVLGQLTAGRHEARAVPSGPTEVAKIAYSVNALADESDRLRSAESEKQRLQERLLLLGRRVRAELDEQEIARLGVVAVGETLRLHRVYLRLLRNGAPSVVLAQWHARGVAPLPPEIDVVVPAGERAVSPLLIEGLPHVTPDVTEDPFYAGDAARPWVDMVGAGAVLTLPVTVDDESVATMSLIADHPRRWTPQDIDFADSAAALLARAIGQNRLYNRQVAAMEQLRELDRAKDDFVSGVSHELRTPLTSISGYVELLQDGSLGDLDESQQRVMGIVKRNVVRLRSLIEDLLTLSRIGSGDFTPTLADVDVVRLVSTVLEDLRLQADERELELDLQLPDEPVVVRGDEGQLSRALLNMTSNAVKFTPSGGSVRLRVTLDEDEQQVTVEVQDTGIGIPEAEVHQLFRRFFRASNASRSGVPGTGLGLVIVQTIAEQHGGRVELSSTEGVGTTVALHLPLPGASDTAHETPADARTRR
jgi:two-component system phosphate regulon sensor histidine kinase PhoR